MITLHPFTTSRESVLPLWSPAAQARRGAPDACALDLFVYLHGMLFTNIQLDDFAPTLGRLIERLSIEDPQAREWTMMAAVNVGAILEYGRPAGALRRTGAVGQQERPVAGPLAKMKLARKHAAGAGAEEKMDVDGETQQQQPSPSLSDASASAEPLPAFSMALQLTFAMLTHVLKKPVRRGSTLGDALNPYLTIVLTFLGTLSQHPAAMALLERAVPWEMLAAFLSTMPRSVSRSAFVKPTLDRSMLLPEDWSLRGMAWGGRKLYDHRFWETSGEGNMEMAVLDEVEEARVDGMIEDDHEDDDPKLRGARRELAVADKRWLRAFWAGELLAKAAEGFRRVEEAHGRSQWVVEGTLRDKVRVWAEEDRAEREAEERRKRGTRWDDTDDMDIDVDGDDEWQFADLSEQSEDDEMDSDEVKVLKVRVLPPPLPPLFLGSLAGLEMAAADRFWPLPSHRRGDGICEACCNPRHPRAHRRARSRASPAEPGGASRAAPRPRARR